MEVHPVGVDEVGEGADFVRGIDGAQFGTFGDIDDTGLGVVLEAEAMKKRPDEVGRELTVGGGYLLDGGAGEFAGGVALIDGDMGGRGGDDGVVGTAARLHGDGVGASAIEHEQGFGGITENLLQAERGPPGPFVVTVSEGVVGIGVEDGGHHLRMNARIIVTSETSHCGLFWAAKVQLFGSLCPHLFFKTYSLLTRRTEYP